MDCEEIRAAGTIADEGLRRRHVGDVTDSKTNNVSHQPRFISGGKSRVYEQVKGVEQRSMSAKVVFQNPLAVGEDASARRHTTNLLTQPPRSPQPSRLSPRTSSQQPMFATPAAHGGLATVSPKFAGDNKIADDENADEPGAVKLEPDIANGRRHLLMHGAAMMTVALFWGMVLLLCDTYRDHPQMTTALGDTKFNLFGQAFTPFDIERWAGIAFASAAFTHILASLAEKHSGKSYQLMLAHYSSIVSASTSLCNLSSLSPLFQSNFGGSVSPVRYLMWIFTTPALILMAHGLGDLPMSEAYLAVAADIVVMTAGYLMEIVDDLRLAFLAGIISVTSCVYTIKALAKFFDSAMQNSTPYSIRFIAISKWSVLVLWNLFPAVFVVKLLVPSVHSGTIEAFNTLIHYFAKVMFVEVLVHDFCLSVAEKEALAATAKEDAQNKRLVHELQELVKQKDTFLSATSHELRTPLHGIIGLTQGIMSGSCGDVNPRMERFLHTIHISGTRLLGMINDILDSASMEANNGLVIANDRVALRPVFQHAVQLISTLIKDSVKIQLDLDDDIPDVLGDEGRIQQIMNNLLGNAAKFTEQGTITIHAVLDGDPDDEEAFVKVSVSDTGCGIPESCQQRIFLPFTQVHDVSTRKYGGTGLGLSLVHSLVGAHGGRVSVRSQVDVGTTFEFTLKRAKGSAQSEKVEVQSSALALVDSDDIDMRVHRNSDGPLSFPVHSGESRPFHKEVHGQAFILSIDDDPVNHMVLEGFLKPKGFKLGVAMSGPEGITFLKHSKTFPDLILLDCMMPEMSGYEVNAKIQEMFPGVCIPVIMVSAKSNHEDVIKGLKSGSHDYIKKPFHQGELMARIDANLALKDSWRKEMEAKLSAKILETILPPQIIRQLKSGVKCVANKHPETSILFSDVVGFTVLASSLSTMDVVMLLNEMFSAFDTIVDKHGVHKVETIGDAYMAASGHDDKPDHAARLFLMACDMMEEVKQMKYSQAEQKLMGSNHLRIRVGLHTGPCHAGVVGIKCPRYCFFGDTVNTASRMESTSSPMCIQMSDVFYKAVSPSVLNEFAGQTMKTTKQIKGKGTMEVYMATKETHTPLSQMVKTSENKDGPQVSVGEVRHTTTSVTNFLKNQCSSLEISTVMHELECFMEGQPVTSVALGEYLENSTTRASLDANPGSSKVAEARMSLMLQSLGNIQNSIDEGVKERLESIEQSIGSMRTEVVQEVQDCGNRMQESVRSFSGSDAHGSYPNTPMDPVFVHHDALHARGALPARATASKPNGSVSGRGQMSAKWGRLQAQAASSPSSPCHFEGQMLERASSHPLEAEDSPPHFRVRTRPGRAQRATVHASQHDREDQEVLPSGGSSPLGSRKNSFSKNWMPSRPARGGRHVRVRPSLDERRRPVQRSPRTWAVHASNPDAGFRHSADDAGRDVRVGYSFQNRQRTHSSMDSEGGGYTPHDGRDGRSADGSMSWDLSPVWREEISELDDKEARVVADERVWHSPEDGYMWTAERLGHVKSRQFSQSQRQSDTARISEVCFPAELAHMDCSQDDALTMFLTSLLHEAFEPVKQLLDAENVDLSLLLTLTEPQLKDMGVAQFGTRMRIVNGAKDLLEVRSEHESPHER